MIEAVKLWNEPNNRSHWDFEVDGEWQIFARTVRTAAAAVCGGGAGVSFTNRCRSGAQP